MAKTNSNISHVEFEFTADGLASFKKKLADLHNIAPVARVKITEDQVLVYSAQKSMHTFKSATLDAKTTFAKVTGDLPENGVDFVILNTKNMVQTVNFFSGEKPIKMSFKLLKGAPVASEAKITDGDLNLSFVGGDATALRAVSAQAIEEKLDLADSEFSFSVTKEEFMKIKRLAQLRDKDAIYVKVRNGDIRIGQPSWDIRVGASDHTDTYIFSKKYLSCIDVTDVITIHAFDSFLCVKGADSNLMIGRELDEL